MPRVLPTTPGGRGHPPAAPGEAAATRRTARRRPTRPRPLPPNSARLATATSPRADSRGSTGRAARRSPIVLPPAPVPGPAAPPETSGLRPGRKRRGAGPANPGRPGIRAPERPGRPDSRAAARIIPSRFESSFPRALKLAGSSNIIPLPSESPYAPAADHARPHRERADGVPDVPLEGLPPRPLLGSPAALGTQGFHRSDEEPLLPARSRPVVAGLARRRDRRKHRRFHPRSLQPVPREQCRLVRFLRGA